MTQNVAEYLVGRVGKAGPGQVVSVDELAEVPAEGEFVWATILVQDGHEIEELVCGALGFPRMTMTHLRGSRLRGGIESSDGRHAFLFAALEVRDELETVAIFFDERRLITVVRQKVALLEDNFKAWLAAPDGFGRTTGMVMASLMTAMAHDLEPVFEAFHDRIENFEAQALETGGENPGIALEERRQLLLLRRKIAPMRDNVKALARRQELFSGEVLQRFEDLADHMCHLVDEIDIGREMVREVVDAEMSVTSNRLNQIMRKMTVITAVLAVATLVASNYGMNFKRMPELEWMGGYPFAIGLMLGLSGLTLWLFKRNGYL